MAASHPDSLQGQACLTSALAQNHLPSGCTILAKTMQLYRNLTMSRQIYKKALSEESGKCRMLFPVMNYSENLPWCQGIWKQMCYSDVFSVQSCLSLFWFPSHWIQWDLLPSQGVLLSLSLEALLKRNFWWWWCFEFFCFRIVDITNHFSAKVLNFHELKFSLRHTIWGRPPVQPICYCSELWGNFLVYYLNHETKEKTIFGGFPKFLLY